jgi:HK97 family phage prohead protease
MEHLLLKATVTAATDEGTFTAVISTAAIDRDKDIVEPSAVVDALHKWVPTGKKVPLSWNHSVAAEDIVGHLNPETAHAVGNEVVADGWVDQSIDHGKHAWRLVKSGTLGFSYGYLVVKATQRKGGGLHIKALDIFEVTATPIPANGETRVLSFKSAEALAEDAKRTAREVEEQKIPEDVPAAAPEPEIDVLKELQEVKARLAVSEKALEDLKKEQEANVTDKEPVARSVDSLRKQANAVALEVASGDLPMPPPKAAPKQPEPSLELAELKRRMRDEMLGVLSGGNIE